MSSSVPVFVDRPLPRDFGPLASAVLGAAAVLLGVGVAWLVRLDAIHGQWLQMLLMGPQPMLVNDLPYLWTLVGVLLLGAFTGLLAWAYKCGEWDRPVLGLLVFSFFADVVPALFQISLLGILLLLADRALRRRDLPFRLTPLIFPLCLVVISYSVTFLQTDKPGNTLADLVFRLSYMSVVVLLPVLLRTRRHLEIFLHFALIAGVLSATTGILQFALSTVYGTPITFTSADYNRVTTPFGIFPRCTGLMLHPNHQSNVLGALAVLLLWLATGPRRQIQWPTRWLYLSVYAYLAVAIILTWSRSGWLALGACTLLIPIVRWPKYSAFFIIPLGVVALVLYETGFAKWLYDTVKNFNASSADFRWHIDHIAIQAWLTYPVFGRGVGQMLNYNNPYSLEVHDTYLQILSEMGLFGMLALGSLALTLGYRMLDRLFRARHPTDREWIIGLTFAAGITLVQNMFAMFLWIKFLWALIALLETAVMVSLTQKGDEEPRDLVFLRPPRPQASHVP
ncbi:MAG: O-antigen ligase domain-containing protein [Planctomycetota bacterium]|nr:MAG: O-antigen ligase domain-containing protein [Planctomycetota bacterium]